ncbi:MAG: ferritin-like domain-containing protein [Thermoanaerobaculia bacterium]
MADLDNKAAIEALNRILEAELAGVVRYTHYSFMIFGYHRIPIVSWLRGQASESMTHAQQAGELISSLGGHPSLGIGHLLETHKHDIGQILAEALDHEREGLAQYRKLLGLVEGRSIMLEEYARTMIAEEEGHICEVEKMVRKPGELDG